MRSLATGRKPPTETAALLRRTRVLSESCEPARRRLIELIEVSPQPTMESSKRES